MAKGKVASAQAMKAERGIRVTAVCILKADSHIACRAAKSLECLSLPFDVHSSAVSDSHLSCHVHAAPMPCSDHTVLLKATVQHGHRETACGLPARVRLLPATTRSSTKIVIRSIPILLTTIHTYDCKER